MKVLVCGGRHYADRQKVYKILDTLQPTCIVTGMAPGADTLAWDWAKARGIPTEEYPADWKKHGRSAGPIRNAKMLQESKPKLVVAFPGGSGTAHMVRISREAHVPVKKIID